MKIGKKLYSIHVKGYRHEWSFDFMGYPEHWKDWEADGLEVYRKLGNLPDWVIRLGLDRVYCKLLEIFR